MDNAECSTALVTQQLEEHESSSNHTTDIASDGDVILVVGASTRRLRVHSVILKNASPVFKALLSPNFAEGQLLLSTADPVEIYLPEDHADALTIICQVLHGRNDGVPEPVDSPVLVSVAIAADKYDLSIPLQYAIQEWLQCGSVSDAKKLWHLMIAAYWFRNEAKFSDITQALVLHHVGSYHQLASENSLDADAILKICMSLEEHRSQLRLNLLQILSDASTFASRTCPCGWNAKHTLRFIESLRCGALLSPDYISGGTVWKSIERVRDIELPTPEYLDTACPNTRYHGVWNNVRGYLAKEIDKLKSNGGLQLKCLNRSS